MFTLFVISRPRPSQFYAGNNFHSSSLTNVLSSSLLQHGYRIVDVGVVRDGKFTPAFALIVLNSRLTVRHFLILPLSPSSTSLPRLLLALPPFPQLLHLITYIPVSAVDLWVAASCKFHPSISPPQFKHAFSRSPPLYPSCSAKYSVSSP